MSILTKKKEQEENWYNQLVTRGEINQHAADGKTGEMRESELLDNTDAVKESTPK